MPWKRHEYHGRIYNILEQPAELAVAGVLWDSCDGLARYIIRRRQEFSGKRVVELGAGCGLAGLVAASIGARQVILTDIVQVLEHLKVNVRANHDETLNDVTKVMVLPCTWGVEDQVEKVGKADIIIASDVVYSESTYVVLLWTMLEIVERRGVVILAHEHRNEYDVHFFHLAARYFVVSRVPRKHVKSGSEMVCLYRMQRRRGSTSGGLFAMPECGFCERLLLSAQPNCVLPVCG